MEDATSLESYLKESAPDAIVHAVNNAIISGDGSAKPIGILSSGFKITVAKESGQAADTIVYRNLVKMKSNLLGQGIWIAHAQCREQLMTLKDDLGNFIYMSGSQFANASVAPFETLLGLPIVYMAGTMPALGDEGDIILANMNYYYSVVKRGGVKSAMSTHLFFDRDITAFKFTLRLDGKCPFKAPVVTQNGNYSMSGFVTIADRA
jgi:HK97 family phage major capsid protein